MPPRLRLFPTLLLLSACEVSATDDVDGTGGSVSTTGTIGSKTPSFAKAFYSIAQGPGDAKPRLEIEFGPLDCEAHMNYVNATQDLDEKEVASLREQTFPAEWWKLTYSLTDTFSDAIDKTLGWDLADPDRVPGDSFTLIERRTASGTYDSFGFSQVGNGSLSRSTADGPLDFRIAGSYLVADALVIEDLDDPLPTFDVVVEGSATWCEAMAEARNNGLPTAPKETFESVDDTDDDDDDDTAEDTADGDDPYASFDPEQYTYFFQVGVDASGDIANFQQNGEDYQTAVLVVLTDSLNRTCTLGYALAPGRALNTPAVSSFISERGLLGALEVKQGNYELLELTNELGDPCTLSGELGLMSTQALANMFLRNADGDPSSLLFGASDQVSPGLLEAINDAVDAGTLTQADAADMGSGWFGLPFTFTGTGGSTSNMECVARGFAVDAAMNIRESGGNYVTMPRSTWKRTGGGLKTGIYVCDPRTQFVF